MFRFLDAAALIAIAAWSFAVAVAGGLAGVVLGNLRLPLVVQLADSPAAGAGANVAISGAAATVAAVAHARAGRVNWNLFAWMAPASLVGAIVGGLISGVLPDRILLAVIAGMVLYGAFEVARYKRPEADGNSTAKAWNLSSAAVVGFGVGVIGGTIGLILGTLRLPAMVRWVGVGPHGAVGTNAAVGAVVGVGGLIGHLPSGVDWGILAAGAAGAMPGAWLGAKLTGRLDERALLRAMAVILAITGTAMAVEAAIG